jgi:hypothetical protein
MALPTFLVIGAMKGGTTALFQYLTAHPDVFMATPKELKFFIEARNWRQGIGWYESKFEPGAGAKARGEASPGYTMLPGFPGVPERIKQVVPDVKLIYVMRDPIERMISHYYHRRSHRKESRSFHKAMRDRSYVAASMYAYQLDAYLEHFPREQLLLLTSESLRDDRLTTLRRVFEFIDVDPDHAAAAPSVSTNRTLDKEVQPVAMERMRGSVAHRVAATVVPRRARVLVRKVTTRSVTEEELELPPDLRANALEVLRPDIARLRTLMGPDFDGWGLA